MSGQTQSLQGASVGLKANKYYAFNETGNIMMVSTTNDTGVIQQTVRDVFNEVSVFFAGMTKAIATTQIPGSKEYYSIYDYSALKRIIDSSGLFVQITEEDIDYSSTSVGASFSAQMIADVLGLVDGVGTVANFASGLVSSLAKAAGGKKIGISANSSKTDSSVGTITFVCEYLMGMPAVSAIVAYADVDTVKQAVKVGPCFSEHSMKTSLTIHKDTYLFVTPTFIKQYSSDLDSVIDDAQYNQFVGFLQSLLKGMAYITSITNSKGTAVVDFSLATGTSVYTINGSNFGASGQVSLGELNSKSTNAFTIKSWSENSITFTVPAGGTYETNQSICIYPAGDSQPAAQSTGKYSVG